MDERNDHAAQARVLLGNVRPDEMSDADSSNWLLSAQIHATLALVEQHRIANLIAVAQMEGGPYKDINNWTRSIRDANGFYVADEDAAPFVHHEIRKGLGL